MVAAFNSAVKTPIPVTKDSPGGVKVCGNFLTLFALCDHSIYTVNLCAMRLTISVTGSRRLVQRLCNNSSGSESETPTVTAALTGDEVEWRLANWRVLTEILTRPKEWAARQSPDSELAKLRIGNELIWTGIN